LGHEDKNTTAQAFKKPVDDLFLIT
jgi:hypothetical protein